MLIVVMCLDLVWKRYVSIIRYLRFTDFPLRSVRQPYSSLWNWDLELWDSIALWIPCMVVRTSILNECLIGTIGVFRAYEVQLAT